MFYRSIQKTLKLIYDSCYIHIKLSKTMDKAVVCHSPGENKIALSFHYNDPNIPINRQFNFERSLEEQLGSCTNRIASNIQNALNKKMKKKKAALQEIAVKVEFRSGDDVMSCDELLKSVLQKESVHLYVEPNVYALDINPPIVKSLMLPSPLMTGITLYPKKLELQFASPSSCKFNWYCSKKAIEAKHIIESHIQWDFVSSGYFFNPQSNMIGHRIRLECIPVHEGREGIPLNICSDESVAAGPGLCPFDLRHEFCHELTETDSFRIVSYNILANLYADSDFSRNELHPSCPNYALSIGYRSQLILKELFGYKADIICLQEVDVGIFQYEFNPVFKLNGYIGIHSPKKHPVSGIVNEGLACIFNTSKFRLVETLSYSLSQELKSRPSLKLIWEHICVDNNLYLKLEERSNILQICVLEFCGIPNKKIIVGTTHLYFHPLGDAIRLIQTAVCQKLIEECYTSYVSTGGEVSLLFCGDFNSTPDTDVFTFITQPDHLKFISLNEDIKYGISDLPLKNPLPLSSACGTPDYTNYTLSFKGCIDYIFYDEKKLRIQQVIPFPSHEEVTQHKAIPSVVMPSDHLALVADLKLM